jgi:DNA-binding Lrp family transcriptional regulator
VTHTPGAVTVSNTELGPDDRKTLAALWVAASDCWDSSADMASVMGLSASTVRMRDTGARESGWPDVRAALRRTAKHCPAKVSSLVERVTYLLTGTSGRWVPAREGAGTGTVVAELLDVHGAHGAIHPRVMALLDGATREELDEARRAIRAEIEQLEELEAAVARTPIAVRVVS